MQKKYERKHKVIWKKTICKKKEETTLIKKGQIKDEKVI